MRTRIAVAVALSVTVALSVACGDDKSPTPTGPTVTPPVVQPPVVQPPAATLTDLSLLGPTWFADDPTLEIGERVQLNLDAEYSDGTTERVTNDATWTSSNNHVATVSGGLIIGQNPGGANVSATYEGIRARSISFRVEQGAQVTVRNVRKERSSRLFERVKGTVVNTGTKAFSGFLEMHARFYSSNGLLLEEARDYVEAGGRFPIDAQRTFDILVRTNDIAGWSYYTLAFLDDDDEEVTCAGCATQRRD